jgi:aspartokinase/homoserine dehydrogenase 1
MIELEKEFENDFYSKDVNKITVTDIGYFNHRSGFSTFHKPYTALIKIKLFLFFSIIQLQVKM